MDRFNTGGMPIVRIGNRMFKYVEQMRLIFGYDASLSSISGFRKDGVVFERNVEENEIESAYFVSNTLGLYLNYKVRVVKYNQESNEILVVFDNADGIAAGITPKIDEFDKNNKYYETYVPDEDVKEIYEVREPEKGFVFDSPRIVFHKRDGKWLPWHELGALLKDDEWI